jgi:hypothetical protein
MPFTSSSCTPSLWPLAELATQAAQTVDIQGSSADPEVAAGGVRKGAAPPRPPVMAYINDYETGAVPPRSDPRVMTHFRDYETKSSVPLHPPPAAYFSDFDTADFGALPRLLPPTLFPGEEAAVDGAIQRHGLEASPCPSLHLPEFSSIDGMVLANAVPSGRRFPSHLRQIGLLAEYAPSEVGPGVREPVLHPQR